MVYAKTTAAASLQQQQQQALPHNLRTASGNGGLMIKTVPRAAPRAHLQAVAGYRHSPNHLSQVYSTALRHEVGQQQLPGSKV